MDRSREENIQLPESWAADWYIDRRLGAGAYSTVYRAVRKDHPGIEAAIKIIAIPATESESDTLRTEGYSPAQSQSYYDDVARQYVSEIELMEQLKGTPNIVGIEDYKLVRRTDTIGNLIYIRMEMLVPLDSVLRERVLTEEEIIRLGIDVCSALQLCEARNILHRDIKPANIFINDKTPGYVFYKLGDFGIARSIQTLTHGLSAKGTPSYMAPEIFFGKPYDHRADLYSLGITLYRLLNNNRLPLIPENDLSAAAREGALTRRMGGEKLPPACRGSKALNKVILKACEFKPGERYACAADMKAALMAAQNGKDILEASGYTADEPTTDLLYDRRPKSGAHSRPEPERKKKPETTTEKPKKKGRKTVLAVLCCLVLTGVLILAMQAKIIPGDWLFGKTTSEPVPVVMQTPEPTEEPTPTPTEEPTPTPTEEPTPTPTEEPTPTPTEEPTPTAEAAARIVRDQTPVTLTAYVGGSDGDSPDPDNKIYRLIRDDFGVSFSFIYPAGDADADLESMIATGNYPDLIDPNDRADLLISNGALINLLDYISPEKTPRLWAHIMLQRDRLIENENGKDVLYIIPGYGLFDCEEIAVSHNGPAFFIQKQVLAEAGYPRIRTLDEYFSVIEKFLAAHPKDSSGRPYTGFAIMCESWRHFCLLNPVQHLMGRPNDGEVLVDVNDSGFHTETYIDKPYARIYYRKLNEEFHKGLIGKDTFTMSFDEYIDALSAGTVLGMYDQGWDFGTATKELMNAGMYGNTYVALGLVYSGQDVAGIAMPTENWKIEEHYLNGSLPTVRRGFGISVNCSCPERIVAMWEEMLSEEWQLILNWGIRDEDYYVENGRLLMTQEQYAHTYDDGWIRKNKAKDFFSASPKKQGRIRDGELAGNSWEPANQDEIVFSTLNGYDRDFLSHYGYSKWTDFFNPPIECAPYGEAWTIDRGPVDDQYSEFLRIQDQTLPELIMCDPAEFDARWEAFAAEISPSAEIYETFMQERVREEADKALNNR